MRVVPYLNFNGKAEEALAFYAAALNGAVNGVMRFGDHQMPGMTPEMSQLIMHGEVHFGESRIYISDTFTPEELKSGNDYTIHLDCFSEEEIHTVFNRLAEGGQIINALEDTFWGATFGYLIDKYGIQWSFNFQKTSFDY